MARGLARRLEALVTKRAFKQARKHVIREETPSGYQKPAPSLLRGEGRRRRRGPRRHVRRRRGGEKRGEGGSERGLLVVNAPRRGDRVEGGQKLKPNRRREDKPHRVLQQTRQDGAKTSSTRNRTIHRRTKSCFGANRKLYRTKPASAVVSVTLGPIAYPTWRR